MVINWLRNRNTVEFFHNPNFNRVGFDTVRLNAGLNSFTISPSKWIEETNAIGIISKSGRYDSGTYAHEDIALEFASWISPEFKLYFIKEFKRLKYEEKINQTLTSLTNYTNYKETTKHIHQLIELFKKIVSEFTLEEQLFLRDRRLQNTHGVLSQYTQNTFPVTIFDREKQKKEKKSYKNLRSVSLLIDSFVFGSILGSIPAGLLQA